MVPYSKIERNEISSMTTGSIYEANIDKTHPLGFGISRYYTLKLDADSYSLLKDEFIYPICKQMHHIYSLKIFIR